MCVLPVLDFVYPALSGQPWHHRHTHFIIQTEQAAYRGVYVCRTTEEKEAMNLREQGNAYQELKRVKQRGE